MDQRLPEFDLSRFLPYQLTIAAERASAGMAKHYRKAYGISVPEWRVLANLLQDGEISVRDVERRGGLDKSKVSRAATRLETEGYVSKSVNEEDRRLVKLELTDKGRALMAELIPLAQDYQAELEAQIEGDLASLRRALDRLLAELR